MPLMAGSATGSYSVGSRQDSSFPESHAIRLSITWHLPVCRSGSNFRFCHFAASQYRSGYSTFMGQTYLAS